MGLFDFLKPKEKISVSFHTEESKRSAYNPWDMTPLPRNNDYAIALFVSLSERGLKVGKTNDDYPRYTSYEFKVNDPIKFHKKVITEGYIAEAEPSVALQHYKVDELKQILEKNNLSTKGKKNDLISRVVENIDISVLNLDTYYVPTDKGKEHLKKYEYVLRLKRYNISFDEFDKYQAVKQSYLKSNDIIWGILNDRYNLYSLRNSYSMARNELLYMAYLLEDEERYIDALYHYIQVLYHDTSGCSECMVLNKEELTIAPGIINSIFKLKEHFSVEMIDRCYSRLTLPHHYIKQRNFIRLVNDIFDDMSIDVKNYI